MAGARRARAPLKTGYVELTKMCTDSRCFRVRSAMLVAVIVALCGCSEDISGQVTKAWSVDQIAAFPDSIAIDGRVMYISASANRDFMPIAPSDGRPLSAGVQLLGLTNGPIEWTPKDHCSLCHSRRPYVDRECPVTASVVCRKPVVGIFCV